MAPIDHRIIVESKVGSARATRNEYEQMYEMMDRVYEVLIQNPDAKLKIWREFDFGKHT